MESITTLIRGVTDIRSMSDDLRGELIGMCWCISLVTIGIIVGSLL